MLAVSFYLLNLFSKQCCKLLHAETQPSKLLIYWRAFQRRFYISYEIFYFEYNHIYLWMRRRRYVRVHIIISILWINLPSFLAFMVDSFIYWSWHILEALSINSRILLATKEAARCCSWYNQWIYLSESRKSGRDWRNFIAFDNRLRSIRNSCERGSTTLAVRFPPPLYIPHKKERKTINECT